MVHCCLLLRGVVPDVQEEDHEWGGPGTESYVSGLAEPLAKLARAARRWRLELSESHKVGYYFVLDYFIFSVVLVVADGWID